MFLSYLRLQLPLRLHSVQRTDASLTLLDLDVRFFLKEVGFMKVTVWNVLFLLEPCLLVQFSCGLIFSKIGRVLCLHLTVLLNNTRADVTDGVVLLQNYRIMKLDYKQVLLYFFAGHAGWPKTIQWKIALYYQIFVIGNVVLSAVHSYISLGAEEMLHLSARFSYVGHMSYWKVLFLLIKCVFC